MARAASRSETEMAHSSSPRAAALLDLPLEILTSVCQQLDLDDLVRVAAVCRRWRHGDGRLETLPKSPVVTALCEHAFARPELVPSTRPIGCSEFWVAYLARCARQRRCREALPFAAGYRWSLFVDADKRMLACGMGASVDHGKNNDVFVSTPVATMDGVRVRSLTAQYEQSFAPSWDGRVYSWGENHFGQLGHGDRLPRSSPVLVEGIEGVRGIVAASNYSLAVTQSGAVLKWRWRMTEACMRGAAGMPQDGARSALALQWKRGEWTCAPRGASRGCEWRAVWLNEHTRRNAKC
jgi:hypothetical protein